MTAVPSIDDPAQFLNQILGQSSPDLLRELLEGFVNTILSAQADQVCGAPHGVRDEARVNRRNGYRHRDLDTRIGTLDVAIPKLREGSFYPDWLLARQASQRASPASAWWPPATCSASAPGGWTSSSKRSGSPACRSHRSRDGRRARPAGGRLPQPAPRPRPVHVRRRRRVDHAGARRRSGGEGRRHGRHRRQQRRLPRSTRRFMLDQRNPRRLAHVLQRPRSPAA